METEVRQLLVEALVEIHTEDCEVEVRRFMAYFDPRALTPQVVD
jgi:hypothetical protein